MGTVRPFSFNYSTHFHLGPFGLPIASIALIYGVCMIVNIVIPPPPYNSISKSYAVWTNYINLIMTGIMVISGVLLSFVFIKKAKQ